MKPSDYTTEQEYKVAWQQREDDRAQRLAERKRALLEKRISDGKKADE